MNDQDPSHHSKRQRRTNARREAERLRRDPKWQFSPKESLSDKMQAIITEELAAQVDIDSEYCNDCAQLREVSGDDSQLCSKHLAQAMGFES